jgi:hypothetical protein
MADLLPSSRDTSAADEPNPRVVGLDSDGGILDGGFPHYDGGGLLAGGERAEIAGTEVGAVSDRDVTWHDATVLANGREITGIALFCGRDRFGIKLVGRELDVAVGESVAVQIDCDDGTQR